MKRMISAAILASSLVLASCGGGGGSHSAEPPGDCKASGDAVNTIKEGTLSVGGFVSPPSVFTAEGSRDKLTGIDSDVVNRIAMENCLKEVTKTVTVAAGVGDLESKRVDVLIGGIGYTPQRAETFGASRPLYTQRMVAVSTSGVSTVSGLADSKGVGVVQGYRWQDELQKVASSKVTVYQNRESMLNDLRSDRIGVATLDEAEARYSVQKLGGNLRVDPIAPDPRIAASQEAAEVVILYTKGNTQLGAAIDHLIEAMIADGRMVKLLERYGLDASQIVK